MKRSKRTSSAAISARRPSPLSCVESAAALHRLQRTMATAVMRPLTSHRGMRERWMNGQKTGRVAAEFIRPNDRLTSFERLEIYNRQYWFRVIDNFYQDFPGLRAALGERKFDRLMQAYLERHPSRSFTLRNLGSQLESFLREEPHWTSPREKLALDIARFEWAQIVAFDGEAKPLLSSNQLIGKNPARLRLRLQPYLTLLELDYPVDDFLILLKKQEILRTEANNAVEVDRKAARSKKLRPPRPKKTFVGIHRLDFTLYYKHLEPEAYRILLELSKGKTLEAACASALRSSRTPANHQTARIQEWFQNWTSLGWFCQAEKQTSSKNL